MASSSPEYAGTRAGELTALECLALECLALECLTGPMWCGPVEMIFPIRGLLKRTSRTVSF